MRRTACRHLLVRAAACAVALAIVAIPVGASSQAPPFSQAAANGREFERAVQSARRVLQAWLAHADAETLLLPDRPEPDRTRWIYTPHNSGADLYPYLILTAQLTDPEIYRGRMMEMLRNEVRYTTVQRSIPANFHFATRELDAASFFGAGEYAKDGLIAVSEYLGRTPWFYRMVDMIADAMTDAPIASRFGSLPAADAETNGDYLQTLVRMATMTGDQRFLAWARRIGDAYVEEVLPGTAGVPGFGWDFKTHTGARRLRLRDHGNETIVGLVMLFALEHQLGSPREQTYRPVIQRMLDRVLSSANPDGLFFNEIDVDTLAPLDRRLSDNWGYVYGAVYSYYLVTGETKYRDAVRRVLRALPKYRNYVWEPRNDPGLPLGSFDGYADAIESAIYLVNREPVPEAFDWIDSETAVMLGMQRPDGHVEDWYGEGNFSRTALLYAYMKSLGVRPERWEPGVRVGAVRDGARVLLRLDMPAPRRIQFDFARHRRVLNLDQNYVRLNEFPEWFTVDENHLYRLRQPSTGTPDVKLGSELIAGVEMAPGDWIVEPAGDPPYARTAR
jgi:predicted secreted protein